MLLSILPESFFIVFLCDLLLYLLCILIVVVSVAFLLTFLILILLGLSALENSLMLLVQFLHLFLLVDPPDFFSSAFDVLDIWGHLYIVSLLPQFRTIYLFRRELQVLIFIEPRNGLNIDIVLLEGRDILA